MRKMSQQTTSDRTDSTKRFQDPDSKAPLVMSSYRGSPQAVAKKLADFGSEDWMSAWNIILVALVFAILIALVHYYTVANLFNTGEVFNGIGWVATGGGLLLFFLVAIMIGSAGAAFGMSWKKNSESAMWTIAAILVLGLLTFYMFASARDERKEQFVLWTGVSVIATIGIAGWGFWSMRSLKQAVSTSGNEIDPKEKETIHQRYNYSMGLLGVSLISSIILIIGAVSLYGAIPASA
jgi:hypothetical protein